MIIFAIIGKSAAGKDTLVKIVSEKLDLPRVVSCTTRPPRPGEIDGIDYKFISKEKMWKLKIEDKLANYTNYSVAGDDIWEYGYLKEDLVKDNCLMILNPRGFRDITRLRNLNATIISFHITASLEERLERSLKRDDSKLTEIVRRAVADEKDFEHLYTDYTIDTTEGTIEEHANLLERIIRNELALQLSLDMQNEFKKDPQKFINGGKK